MTETNPTNEMAANERLSDRPEAASDARAMRENVQAAALAALAEREERKNAREKTSGIDKGRSAMLLAISRRNRQALLAALEEGVDPNFMAEKYGGLQSPLGFAGRQEWDDGVLLLIENGAKESLARRQCLAENAELRAGERKKIENQRGPWPHVASAAIFEAMLRNEDDPLTLASLGAGVKDNIRKGLILLREGRRGLIENWDAMERHAFDQILARSGVMRQRSDGNKLLQLLWAAAPQRLGKQVEWRWERAVRSDLPELLASLAQNEAPLPLHWTGRLKNQDFPNASRGGVPPGLLMNPEERGGSKTIEATLWAIAVVLGATDSLRVLGKIPGIKEAALADPKTPKIIGFTHSVEALREAARQGLVLSECVSESQNTPFHSACVGWTNKTLLLELAKLCPEWVGRKNAMGLSPQELLAGSGSGIDKEKQPALFAEIERIVLKKDMAEVKKEISAEKRAAKKLPKAERSAPAAKKPTTRRL